MNRYITTENGGIPYLLNDLRFICGQAEYSGSGIYNTMNQSLQTFGDDWIVYGCNVTGSIGNRSLSEGLVMLDGELLKVDAKTGINNLVNYTYVKDTSTYNSDGLKTMQNGTDTDTYQEVRAIVSGGAGGLNFSSGDRYEDVLFEMISGSTHVIADANLPVATATKNGLADLATAVEVQTGTEDSKCISPLRLRTQEGWTTMSLTNSWLGTVKYKRDNMGFVHFSGALVKGASTSSETLFTLPAGYRPYDNCYFTLVYGTPTTSITTFAVLEILTDGTCNIDSYAGYSTNDVFYMSPVNLPTA